MACGSCVGKLKDLNSFYDKTNQTDVYLRNLSSFFPKHPIEVADPILKIRSFTEIYGHHWKICTSKHIGSPEIITVESGSENVPKKTSSVGNSLEAFIITPVTDSDLVFTCRECLRTYTTKLSALGHTCATRLQSDGEDKDVEIMEVDCVDIVSPVQIMPGPKKRKKRKKSEDKGEMKRKCEVCGMHFPISLIETHIETHKTTEARLESRLNVDLKSCNKDDENEVSDTESYFVCKLCDKFFSRRCTLETHQKTHGVERVQTEPSEQNDSDIELIDVESVGDGGQQCPVYRQDPKKDHDFDLDKPEESDSKKKKTRFPCEVCGKNYKEIWKLEKHKQKRHK